MQPDTLESRIGSPLNWLNLFGDCEMTEIQMDV